MGLRVKAKLDRAKYPLGAKFTKSQMDGLHIQHNDFRGEWNYELWPQRT